MREIFKKQIILWLSVVVVEALQLMGLRHSSTISFYRLRPIISKLDQSFAIFTKRIYPKFSGVGTDLRPSVLLSITRFGYPSFVHTMNVANPLQLAEVDYFGDFLSSALEGVDKFFERFCQILCFTSVTQCQSYYCFVYSEFSFQCIQLAFKIGRTKQKTHSLFFVRCTPKYIKHFTNCPRQSLFCLLGVIFRVCIIIFSLFSLLRKPTGFAVLLRFIKISFLDEKNRAIMVIEQRVFCVQRQLPYNLLQCQFEQYRSQPISLL